MKNFIKFIVSVAVMMIVVSCNPPKEIQIQSTTDLPKKSNYKRVEYTTFLENNYKLSPQEKLTLSVYPNQDMEFVDSAFYRLVDTAINVYRLAYVFSLTPDSGGKILSWNIFLPGDPPRNVTNDTAFLRKNQLLLDTVMRVGFRGITFVFVARNGHYIPQIVGEWKGRKYITSGDNLVFLPLNYQNWRLTCGVIDSTESIPGFPQLAPRDEQRRTTVSTDTNVQKNEEQDQKEQPGPKIIWQPLPKPK